MTTKLEDFPETETEPGDLIDHNKARDMNLRILSLLSGTSVLCVVMEELDDSFLVALPCKLMIYGEKKVIETYMPVRFVRFFKSAMVAAIPCFGDFELYYIEWLLENGNSLFPRLVVEDVIALLRKRHGVLTNQASALKESLESIAENREESTASVKVMIPFNDTKH